jgi:copper chaperone CopZ
MLKKTFAIVGMSCSSCAMRLESLEDDLPGVVRARASYRRQHLEIEYDEDRLTEAKIVEAIQALGYEVQL